MLCIFKVIKKIWLIYYIKNVTNHQLSNFCWHYCEILIVKKKEKRIKAVFPIRLLTLIRFDNKLIVDFDFMIILLKH
jgi:hypothetical protein